MTEYFSLKDAVDLYHSFEGTTYELWTLFTVVASAVLGFAFSKETKTEKPYKFGLLLSAAFLFFAISNHVALIRAQRTVFNVVAGMKEYIKNNETKLPSEFISSLTGVEATYPGQVSLFHWACTLLVLVAIWIPIFLSRKLPNSSITPEAAGEKT